MIPTKPLYAARRSGRWIDELHVLAGGQQRAKSILGSLWNCGTQWGFKPPPGAKGTTADAPAVAPATAAPAPFVAAAAAPAPATYTFPDQVLTGRGNAGKTARGEPRRGTAYPKDSQLGEQLNTVIRMRDKGSAAVLMQQPGFTTLPVAVRYLVGNIASGKK
jgi:hypothetical protein